MRIVLCAGDVQHGGGVAAVACGARGRACGARGAGRARGPRAVPRLAPAGSSVRAALQVTGLGPRTF